MMEVTRCNFKETLADVKTAIENATFMSIDCEFSGLNTVHNINAYDTQKKYYEKVRSHCKDFLVLQFGLCAFRLDEDKVFKQRAYNFYIFRRPVNRNVPDNRFLCQTSSIDFLIKQGFDFNKLFKEGISYLNTQEEAKYRENLTEYQKNRATFLFSPDNSPNNTIPVPAEDAPFVDDAVKQITDFLSTEEKEIQLPRCNAFVRRLIYQTVRQRLGNKVSLETRQLENKERVLVASKFKDKNSLKAEEENRVAKELKELDDVVGFAKVIKMLVDSNKLIIGHNMCLDLLHLIDKFLIPLPEDYEEFKECAHHFFPRLLDTKYMSKTPPFRELIASSVLGHVLKTVQEKPFKIPEIEIEEGGSGYSLKDSKEHEAGFDAYITGISFLAMYNYLYESEECKDGLFSDLNLLSPFVNRLFLMRLQDEPYIHLGAPDGIPIPSRDHVFHITFPKEWKMNDIIQLFSPFGNVHVAWIDETSAYVGLVRREQASVALRTLSQSDRYKVTTFTQREAVLTKKTFISSPLPKVTKKRQSEDGFSLVVSKRKKLEQGNHSKRRAIEPILEEDESQASPVVAARPKRTAKKRLINKTFKEPSDWD